MRSGILEAKGLATNGGQHTTIDVLAFRRLVVPVMYGATQLRGPALRTVGRFKVAVEALTGGSDKSRH